MGRRRRAAQADGSGEYAARKQELLQIAARVFRNQGYDRTTLGDIAVAAGTERASLYYYFANKEELYIELIKQVQFSPSGRSEIIAAEKRSAADRLRALVVELMTAFHEQYPLLYLNLREGMGTSAPLFPAHEQGRVESGERHFQAFRKVVEDGIRDGTFRSTLPPGLTAEGVIGMLMWSSQWFDPEKSRYSGREIGEAFADFFLHGLVVEAPVSSLRTSKSNRTASAVPPRQRRRSRSG